MIDPELLKIMCCPETHQPIAVADPALIEKLNQLIAESKLEKKVVEVSNEDFTKSFNR